MSLNYELNEGVRLKSWYYGEQGKLMFEPALDLGGMAYPNMMFQFGGVLRALNRKAILTLNGEAVALSAEQLNNQRLICGFGLNLTAQALTSTIGFTESELQRLPETIDKSHVFDSSPLKDVTVDQGLLDLLMQANIGSLLQVGEILHLKSKPASLALTGSKLYWQAKPTELNFRDESRVAPFLHAISAELKNISSGFIGHKPLISSDAMAVATVEALAYWGTKLKIPGEPGIL